MAGDERDRRTELAYDPSIVGQLGESTFFRTLVENTSDGLVTIDEDSTVVCANPAVGDIFGYDPSELVGESLLTLVPERLRERHVEAVREYLATGERHLDWNGVEFPGLHRDGHEVPLAISFQEHVAGDRRLFTGVIRDVTERRERERELRRYDAIVDTVGDAVYQLDPEGNFVAVNDVVVEATGYSRERLLGAPASLVLDEAGIERSVATARELLANDDEEVGVVRVDVHTADGETIPVEARIALLRSNGEITGTVGVARDVSERVQRERELRRQRNELRKLDRINSVIRDINQSLIGATTRAEIEGTVCERLTGAEPYVSAWIGDRHPGTGRVEPRASAGVADEYLEEATITADDSATGRGPTGRAFRTGEPQATQNLLEAPEFEPWRELAREYGLQSSIAVPLTYGDTAYGVLNVYADRPFAFDEREQAVLAELGEMIGHAISALESRKLLHADTVLELEFRMESSESFFVEASEELDCALRLEAAVPASDRAFLYYITVEGTSVEAVVDLADREPDIEEVVVVSEHDDESLLLFRVAGSSAVLTIIEAGARIESARAEGGVSTLVAEVAPDADTRAIINAVQDAFPGAELVAQREVERSVQTSQQFHEQIRERLTDRQRAALDAAYHGGYFARPRNVSGSELAESLGITPSTFHQHLQAALAKVVGAVLDEG